MKGRDILKGMVGKTDQTVPDTPSTSHTHRPTGAVRAMNLSLGKLGEEAAAAKSLRESLASGQKVVEIDPSLVEMSFIRDRIPVEIDIELEALKLSIRESGQQVPILVRPHPSKANTYQAAYGHRRLRASLDLEISVKAIVRHLTDEELVLAQGQENGARVDLSYIERALFAHRMQEHGFDRDTIAKALATDKPETSRLLQVAQTIDPEIILAIGPAPRVGRPRWLALAEKLKDDTAVNRARTEVASSTFLVEDTNRRFERLWKSLGDKALQKESIETVRTKKGLPIASVFRVKKAVKITVTSPAFADYLLEKMPDLVVAFETKNVDDSRD
ncbi:plasmid partitioning protein RepB (plasmid) [Agrobacterium rosae]|uniref:Plasmid partitioning protein RepB n=1 Tax=Agrobacterium rosae TaxID=1972867 RepID=A0ABU4W354_9HYPH|nr:plasmid partitioning protein RepB [Agrobacterium rosae]MDX8331857.1 plasmid partitioning protein RepB [Agrobacterium rosae]